MEKQLVVFELAEEQYGVEIASVESIIKMQPLTRVPLAPAFVDGVINLRAQVIPVIDLRHRLGLETQPAGSDSRIVIAALPASQRQPFGLIVDGVSEVLTISEAVIEPPPSLVTSAQSEFITGLVRLDERLVILLDLSRILSAAEQAALA